jgi:hypothetical protein
MDVERFTALADDAMVEHGLISKGWVWEFSRTKRQLGCCEYGHRRLLFSLPFIEVNDEAECLDTILHEIAHALVGPGAGHGPRWRAMARSIGARPRATTNTAKSVEALWTGRCPTPDCDVTRTRHRLTETSRRMACRACCGRFNHGRWSEEFVFVWSKNVAVAKPTKAVSADRSAAARRAWETRRAREAAR